MNDRSAREREPDAVDARVAGALWGFLVGDALGFPFASLTAAEIARGETAADHGARARPPGTWTDAGSLTLAVLDSILSVGFDPEDQAERILDWYRGVAYVAGPEGRLDADERTTQAVHAIERGTPPEQCGPAEEGLAGGSAVKMALALALADPWLTYEDLLSRALATARILDGRPRAAVATALYAALVRERIVGSGERGDASAAVVAPLMETCERHPERAVLLPAARDVLQRGHGYRVPGSRETSRPWDAVWAAWEVSLAADSPVDGMERAIRLGGETDTAAALVGGLVGATFGFEAIPTSLLFALRSRSLAGHLVDRLLSRAPSGLEPRHLAVDWLEADSIQSGRLGIAGLPGRGPNSRDRVRRRLLATDADHLASLGVTLLVLLVMDHELEPLRPDAYVAALVERGISVVREPVAELDVPVSRDAFRSALDAAEEALSRGERVVVACGTGRGRASTFAACVLRDEGVPADEALAIVSGNRPRAIETAAQEAFVRGWP